MDLLHDPFECCPPKKDSPPLYYRCTLTHTDYLFMHVRIPWTDEVDIKIENKIKRRRENGITHSQHVVLATELEVREGFGGMRKMNFRRSAKTDWIQKKDKTELVHAYRFISEGFRYLKWSHVFNYGIYRIIILLRMEFIISRGIFLFLVSRFLFLSSTCWGGGQLLGLL